MPWKYRNIINPWQTYKEIRKAINYLDRLFKGCSEEERKECTREDDPDRYPG